MVAIYLMAVVGFIDLCFDASSLAAFGDTCVLPIRASIAASGCARKRKGERYPLPPILPPFYHQANVVPYLPSLAHPCGSPAGELFLFLFFFVFISNLLVGGTNQAFLNGMIPLVDIL